VLERRLERHPAAPSIPTPNVCGLHLVGAARQVYDLTSVTSSSALQAALASAPLTGGVWRSGTITHRPRRPPRAQVADIVGRH